MKGKIACRNRAMYYWAHLLACRDRSVLDKLVPRALTRQPGDDLFEGQPDEPLQD